MGAYLLLRDDDQGGAETDLELRDCTNRPLGFVIGYPVGWSTAQTSPETACLFFDPAPFEVPENTDFSGVAIEVVYAQQTYADTVRGFTDERFADVRDEDETTVAGRNAVRFETVATGEGLYDRGTSVYGYVVDRSGRAFVIQTVVAPGGDVDARKEAVDAAAGSLRFTRE